MGQKTGGTVRPSRDCRALVRRISTGVGVAMVVVLAMGSAMAAPETSTKGVTAPASAQPAATPASPFTSVNLRGGASSTGSVIGACDGLTCNASAGDCACTTYTGTLTGTGYGKVSAVIAITENDDDTTPDGAGGRCFPAMGTATLTTPGAKPSVAVLGLTGALCQFEVGTAFTVNGNFAYSQEAATGGTNKFATSFGTGNISVMESVDQATSSLPSAVSLTGILQLKQ